MAEPRAKLSRHGLQWALEGIVVQHLTGARVAEGLGAARNTANDDVLAEGKRVLARPRLRQTMDRRSPQMAAPITNVDNLAGRHT